MRSVRRSTSSCGCAHWAAGAQWIAFLGKLDRSHAHQENLHYRVEGPDGFKLWFAVRQEDLLPAVRMNERGRVPRGALEELLRGPPMGSEEIGLSVVGTPVTLDLWTRLQEWNGQAVTGKLRPLTAAQWTALRHRAGQLVPSHSSGWVHGADTDDSDEVEAVNRKLKKHWERLERSVSPKPPSRSRSASPRPGSSRGSGSGQPRSPSSASASGGDPGEGMLATYVEARSKGEDDASALQAVASGFGE